MDRSTYLYSGLGAYQAAPGLFLFTSAVWQMNTAVLVHGDRALVVDPGYFPREVESVRDFVQQRGLNPVLLFTHGDFDHVVGHQAFPRATRWGSAALSDRDGAAVERQVQEFDAQYYVERPEPFRFPELDVAVPAAGGPAFRELIGRLQVLFYPAPGHTADGLLTVVPELRLTLVGDYLSDLEFPVVEHGLAEYRETLALVRRLAEEYDLGVLVPGHGRPAFGRGEILARVSQDEEYLEALWSAAHQARAAGLSAGEAGRHLEGITYRGMPIPRRLQAEHRGNAARVLEEVGWTANPFQV